MRLSTIYTATNLDPNLTREGAAYHWTTYVYSHLLKFTPGREKLADGSVEGDAMNRWEQPDPTTLIMHLRPNLKFDQRPPTSGRAATSEDVVISWDKFVSTSNYAGDLANSKNKDAPITSLRATDASTIEIKTAFPDAQLFTTLAYRFDLHLMPKEAYSGGFDSTTDMRGSSAWTLERFQPGLGATFKKNPNYYDAPTSPLLDGIEDFIITDQAQAEAQFKAKNIDFGGVPKVDLLAFSRDLPDTRIDLDAPPSAGPTISLSWKASNPFRDVRVRQALSMLIDRDAFLDLFDDVKTFQAAGIKLNAYWNTPLGGGYGAFYLDPKDSAFGQAAKYYKLNIDEAKKLLAAAGHQKGFETPFTFVAGTRYGRDWEQRAEALMSMLSKGGIRARANAVDYTSVWIPQYFRQHGDWDGLAMYPNGGRGDPGQWFQEFIHSSGASGQTSPMYPLSELDDLIAKQRRELDSKKRISLFHDIQRYCAENIPVIPQGGGSDEINLSWKWVHGSDVYHPYLGYATPGTEVLPRWWIDESQRT